MRKHLLALALTLGSLASPAGFPVTPGWAQAPPPVPAEPDTERRSRYAASAQTTFTVSFDVYGDGTDYQNWLEVWVNGIRITQSGNWTLSLASGSLTTLSRPIVAGNASVVFATAQTGTVDIVGARRPRRTSQLAENLGVTARDFNQIVTDLWMTQREAWDFRNRGVRAPPGDTLTQLPPAATRALGALGFNASGDLIVNAGVLSGATVSAPMVAVVQAASLALARTALGTDDAANLTTGLLPLARLPCGIDTNTLSTKAADYTILAGDCGKTTVFTGISWTVTLPAAATLSGANPAYTTRVCNGNANDISHHPMRLSGFPDPILVRLYMGQCVGVKIVNGVWQATEIPGRFRPTFNPHIYVDTGGSDANGGLVSNAAGNPILTMQKCISILQTEYDLGGVQPRCRPTGGQTFVGSFTITGMNVASSVTWIDGNGSVAILKPTPFTTPGTGAYVAGMQDYAGYFIFQNVQLDCTGGAATCVDLFMHQEAGADFFTGASLKGNAVGHLGVQCDARCKVNFQGDASSAIQVSGSFNNVFDGSLGATFVFSNGLGLAASTSVAGSVFSLKNGSFLTFTGALNGGAGTSVTLDVFTLRNLSGACLVTYSNSWSVAPTRKFSVLGGSHLANVSANAIVGTSAGIVTATGFAAGLAPDGAGGNTGVNAGGC